MDPQHSAVAIEPYEVEREAHPEGVDRARARQQHAFAGASAGQQRESHQPRERRRGSSHPPSLDIDERAAEPAQRAHASERRAARRLAPQAAAPTFASACTTAVLSPLGTATSVFAPAAA